MLPNLDAQKLLVAMNAFAEGQENGYTLKNYKNGIRMITDSGRGQGRCLFFVLEEDAVIVKFYKKESQAVPDQVMSAALKRKERYEKAL